MNAVGANVETPACRPSASTGATHELAPAHRMTGRAQSLATQLDQLYEPVADGLSAAARIFDEELVSEIDHVNELCRYVSSYRGKMLRPGLLLLSGRAAGEINAAHPVLAAVVEMVHMATLVHDDVLDDARQRRRQPTIRALSGNAAAVLLGDCLISHAFHLCSSLADQHASRRIAATTNTVCECELLQNLHRGDLDLTEAAYTRIIEGKTGTLTAVACELGAHHAGAGPAVVQAMHGFGMSVGVAFQIVDDLLDLVGDERSMGKTLGRDLELGKLTLPLIHGLRSGDRVAVSSLRSICTGGADTGDIGRLLHHTGSLEYARAVAGQHVEQAVRRLDALPPGPARESLAGLAEFIIQRQT